MAPPIEAAGAVARRFLEASPGGVTVEFGIRPGPGGSGSGMVVAPDPADGCFQVKIEMGPAHAPRGTRPQPAGAEDTAAELG